MKMMVSSSIVEWLWCFCSRLGRLHSRGACSWCAETRAELATQQHKTVASLISVPFQANGISALGTGKPVGTLLQFFSRSCPFRLKTRARTSSCVYSCGNGRSSTRRYTNQWVGRCLDDSFRLALRRPEASSGHRPGNFAARATNLNH